VHEVDVGAVVAVVAVVAVEDGVVEVAEEEGVAIVMVGTAEGMSLDLQLPRKNKWVRRGSVLSSPLGLQIQAYEDRLFLLFKARRRSRRMILHHNPNKKQNVPCSYSEFPVLVRLYQLMYCLHSGIHNVITSNDM
jgi:hypothetical protein